MSETVSFHVRTRGTRTIRLGGIVEPLLVQLLLSQLITDTAAMHAMLARSSEDPYTRGRSWLRRREGGVWLQQLFPALTIFSRKTVENLSNS